MNKSQYNEVEVIGLDGKTWYLWGTHVKDEEVGFEVFRALRTYPNVRVNHRIYSVEG